MCPRSSISHIHRMISWFRPCPHLTVLKFVLIFTSYFWYKYRNSQKIHGTIDSGWICTDCLVTMNTKHMLEFQTQYMQPTHTNYTSFYRPKIRFPYGTAAAWPRITLVETSPYLLFFIHGVLVVKTIMVVMLFSLLHTKITVHFFFIE